MKFRSKIRYWRPEQNRGLAVADVPAKLIPALGGLKQARVSGQINGVAYTSNVMPAGSGCLTLSVSKSMMKSANVTVGDTTDFLIEPAKPR